MNDIQAQYEKFWKVLVENPDGTVNKEHLMKELYDFSMLIFNLQELYDRITNGRISHPATKPEEILEEFEQRLAESYDFGYKDAQVKLNS